MKQITETYCPPKIEFHLEYILDHDEDVIHFVKQKKNLFILRSEYVITTNKRIIFCIPDFSNHVLELYDFTWENVKECSINKKLLSTTITVQLISNRQIETNYLPNDQAILLYKHIIKMITDK